MARINPEDWRHGSFIYENEKETLAWLSEALSDDYVVWAGVEWASRLKTGVPVYGEIDMIVVGPSGDVVLIEQKNGAVYIDEDGDLKKSYGHKEKSVGRQLRHSFTAMLQQWEQAYGKHEQKPYMSTLMYLPDHHVQNIASLQLEKGQVLDAGRARELPAELERLLGLHPPNPEKHRRVMEFLEGQLLLAFDIGAALDNQEKVYRTFGNRLAHFVDALTFSPWRLHVQGAAGSGKTQLAGTQFGRALREGRRALYVCFNRPLADRLSHALLARVPEGASGIIATVDRLSELYHGETAAPPESYAQMTDRFVALRARAMSMPVKPEWVFDQVIVDEGQDFSAQQAAFVEFLLAPGGHLLWMADARQLLYTRDDTAALDTTLRIDLRENYRCGRAIVTYTNLLLGLDPPDIAAGAVQGDEPQLFVVPAGNDIVDAVAQQVRRLLAEGYEATDIAVLSAVGRERSRLQQATRIAGWTVRRFTHYDDDGNQVYSDGLLRVDTIYRFKGLQAAAVILAEIDFDELTPRMTNLLYTGMTRCRCRS